MDEAAGPPDVVANCPEAANSDFDHVMKATIYLVNMAEFAKVNEVYASYFKTDYRPARVTVAVAVAALPRGASVEIEMFAISKS